MDNKELRSIFKGIANKDEKEFNKLYKNYKNLIYAVSFSMLKNKEDSEEVVQTVFMKIWNIKRSNLPESNEATWLYNVVKNETINYLRKQKHTLNIDDLYYIDEENEEIKNIIDKEYYNKILSKINTNEQEIVSLKILSGLSFREIAQILNIPISTVQWKYYKSLHILKMLMSNLTMFILTYTLYLKQKNSIKEIANKNEEKQSYNKIENIIESSQAPIDDRETERSDSTIKNENETMQDATKKEQESTQTKEDINEVESSSIYNIETENTIVEEPKPIKQQNSTLFYISNIFLIITIVFSVIWIKQRLHKSTK